MVSLLVIAAVQTAVPSDIVVGGWDKRPTLTVAQGNPKNLALLKSAAKKCGFSRIWIWDDSDKALLWVLAEEASPKRQGCLNRWRTSRPSVRLKWKLQRTR